MSDDRLESITLLHGWLLYNWPKCHNEKDEAKGKIELLRVKLAKFLPKKIHENKIIPDMGKSVAIFSIDKLLLNNLMELNTINF